VARFGETNARGGTLLDEPMGCVSTCHEGFSRIEHMDMFDRNAVKCYVALRTAAPVEKGKRLGDG